MNYKHGLSSSRAYASWKTMIYRCTNPKSPNYEYHGGRGITVCARWRDFLNFLADMGERPEGKTLDRIENEGNYEPGNCRWATRSQQQRNSRNAKLAPGDVRWIRSNPDGLTHRQMAEVLGVSGPQVSLIQAGKKWSE